ncbi:NAD(P)/FAD-dependent oxidoreductase [Zavarzinia compransoris]|uniref:FAD-dependent oxidoreductase n=1 Tax=Zavarzinia compransoris TaxID=1264899 RepID=A0A317DVZ1_9PROT|nr:FAD-binding oxidoreductase [Zavarzinia compransoris]PWR18858.1 FAD-dependent oxidoreductase [Zavarzinia compransoris]TDP48851.1 glycine/D-amino acid oxidase-like deaminating enzyme [Zavarzinia compransoris]
MSAAYDVVIAGGAVTGSSAAYHLAAHPGFGGRVLVVEKDPSYQFCASALSAASIRQQYSTEINVRISLYGIRFLRAVGEILAVDGEAPEIGLHEGGYLFLASAAGRPVLEANHRLQAGLGADIALLGPEGLRARFPWLNTEGLALGSLGVSGEGWFDGYGLMQAFRRKARALGVDYRAGSVAEVRREGGRVTGVVLADGSRIACGALVNAAGGGGAALARAAGIEIPVRNRKRMIFTFTCADPVERAPLLIDPTGLYFRPEGRGFLCGLQPPADRDPDADGDFEVEHDFFDSRIWPILAGRVPAFERIRPGRAWAGHYDMNLFDHNAIVGPVPGLAGFYLANGFSGHGLQQSPAIGRGLAELIVDGGYRSLDLSPLSFARIAAGAPLREANVV